MTTTHAPHSVSDLLKGLAADASELARQEIRLARYEMTAKARSAVRHLAVTAAGGGLCLVAALVLATAINRGLTALMALAMPLSVAVWLAPLTLALVLAVAGAVLVRRGLEALENDSLNPEHTRASLKENSQWIAEKI